MHARELQYRRNADILVKYIPEAAVPTIAEWIIHYDFKLKIKKERNSRLGDYTPPREGLNHLITINHNLNKYAFLITLVHEVAHLVEMNHGARFWKLVAECVPHLEDAKRWLRHEGSNLHRYGVEEYAAERAR